MRRGVTCEGDCCLVVGEVVGRCAVVVGVVVDEKGQNVCSGFCAGCKSFEVAKA